MNNLEKIRINDSDQWVLIRGKDAKAPLIIHVQAGPGLPLIPDANTMENLLHFEDKYLVAYWDQRGCGKSFNKNIDLDTMTLSQLSDDVIACTEYLLKKYNKDKAIVIGYSMGATTSLMAAAKNSQLFSQLFLVGIDINIPVANKFAIDYAVTKAKDQNNQKLLREIIELSNHPIIEANKFQQRAKILTNLGGIIVGATYNKLLLTAIKNMLFCNSYSLGDIPKTIKGMEFCQNALLPELNALNLFEKVKSVDVPVHFCQGKLDGIAPYQTAVSYYDYLQAQNKSFTDFDRSAHMIQYDEPGKFAELVIQKIMK